MRTAMDREKIAQAIYGVGWTQKGVHTYPDGLQEEDDYRVTWENTPDERWGLSYAAADAILALLSTSPDVAGIVERLTSTTQEVAATASMDMDLWDRHSNAVLKAATALQSLSQSLASKDAEMERLTACGLESEGNEVRAIARAEAAEARIAELEKALEQSLRAMKRVNAEAGVASRCSYEISEDINHDVYAAIKIAEAALARQGAKP